MSEIVAPLINGRRFSFASIETFMKIGLTSQEIFIDLDDISYSESLVISYKQGTSRVPIGSTSGVWEPQECSVQMGKSSLNKLVLKTGPGYLGINMLFNVSFADFGEIICWDTIIGRITGIEDGFQAGPDALSSRLKFMPTTPILRNGIPGMLNRVF